MAAMLMVAGWEGRAGSGDGWHGNRPRMESVVTDACIWWSEPTKYFQS